MTEITGNNGVIQRPWFAMKPSRETHLIDPLVFVGAFVSAPIVIAIIFCWALFIPVIAIGFGFAPYLLFGTPLYLWLLSRGEVRVWVFALLSFLVNIPGSGVMAMWQRIGYWEQLDLLQLYLGFGSIFAPAWSITFIMLYRSYRRDRFLPHQS
ncbi:MAG: hypothetical protein AAF340_18110 [Pseudomonadota bacterium]